MKGRIHLLQNEIRTIEDVLDSLSGPMLEIALEEIKNLQFEMEMLNRAEQKYNNEYFVSADHFEDEVDHAY